MKHKSYTRQQYATLMIVAVLFFSFGFVTWINSMLIPYFKVACELSNFQAYFVTFAFYISYLIMAVPASLVIKKYGFKKSLMTGFWTMAMGAFMFIPAAYSRTYGIFLAGLFLIGIGLAFLQTAANPYVTLLGPKERAAQRISIMGICNKFAGILAPLILASAILRPTDNELFNRIPFMGSLEREQVLSELIQRVITPYICLAILLFILGLFIRYSGLPELDQYINRSKTNIKEQEVGNENTSAAKPIYKYPHLILGAIAIFVHVGSQVVGIDTIIAYAQSSGMPITEAKVFPSYTLFATICGYVSGIILMPKIISQLTIFKICTILGLVLSLLTICLSGQVTLFGHKADISIWFLVLLGLSNSMIWAGIWPLALDRLGSQVKLGASLLIMGLCGNAVIPLFYGYLADHFSPRFGYIVLIPCYLYLIFYATYGHRINFWKIQTNRSIHENTRHSHLQL